MHLFGDVPLYIEGVTAYNLKLNYMSFSVDHFFLLVANSVDPDEMRYFDEVHTVWQTGHIYAQTV